jgi:hypothetical protein
MITKPAFAVFSPLTDNPVSYFSTLSQAQAFASKWTNDVGSPGLYWVEAIDDPQHESLVLEMDGIDSEP